MGIAINASVSQAVINGNWNISKRCPSIVNLLRACLPVPPLGVSSPGNDTFMWRTSTNSPHRLLFP